MRLGELSMLTVGNPLQWLDSATILTDSSRGSYRRISVIDDRLVGYLALGPTHPDGLAIKRLIDEGLSIRDIKKDLLRGESDVRKYFSRQRTYAAQRMVITGKLPPPAQVQPAPAGRSLRETGPLAAPGTESVYPLARTAVNTDPTLNVPVHLRYTPSNTGNRWEAIQPAHPVNPAAPYTQPPLSTRPLPNSESIPTYLEALFFEGGISPGQETNRAPAALRVVESTLV